MPDALLAVGCGRQFYIGKAHPLLGTNRSLVFLTLFSFSKKDPGDRG